MRIWLTSLSKELLITKKLEVNQERLISLLWKSLKKEFSLTLLVTVELSMRIWQDTTFCSS